MPRSRAATSVSAPRRAGAYAAAGVDIAAGNRAKSGLRALARATFGPEVLTDLGGFGGLFRPPAMSQPVLVASMDGVGTKLKIAFESGVHDTVGRDLVNHCVNDILAQGARPLFFLDYLALDRMVPAVVRSVVRGVARGCRENGCALLGGETAAMPGFYAAGEYDLAGCIVGAVEAGALLTGAAIRPGDHLLGLPSAGLHTNGFALARRLLLERAGYRLQRRVPELGTTLQRALLAEHRSYWPLLAPLLAGAGKGSAPRRGRLRGLAHITGGGITENLPRILPPGRAAEIDPKSWTWPPIFRLLQKLGGVSTEEMRRTFNLGVGMIAVVAPADLDFVLAHFRRRRESVIALGRVAAGRPAVHYLD